MQALEQIVKPSQLRKEIDVYGVDTIVLYTPTPKPISPTIGPMSGSPEPPGPNHMIRDHWQGGNPTEQRGPYGNIISETSKKAIEGPGSIARAQYNLDKGFKLQERFDFSRHGGTGSHLNYDLLHPGGSVLKGSSDILGKAHSIKLTKF